MTEAELIEQVRRLVSDPKRRTTMAKYRRIPRPRTPEEAMPPPTTAEAVGKAEAAVGFRFPPLLGHLWTEVGNGGFGPGYGLFGIEGGFADDAQGLTTAELYLATSEDEAWEKFLEAPWPRKLVPICDWGCGHLSAIDCTTLEGEVVDLLEGFEQMRKGMTFAQWMEAWVSGVELRPW